MFELAISLVIVLVVVGLVLYLVETFIPMAPGFAVAIRAVVILALCLYLLRIFMLHTVRF